MTSAQGGRRPRPPAKAPAGKTKPAAGGKGGRPAAKPRAAKPRPKRRRKGRAFSLLDRLIALPRLVWLLGLLLVLSGVVLAWWWGGRTPAKPVVRGTLPVQAPAPAVTKRPIPADPAQSASPRPPAPPTTASPAPRPTTTTTTTSTTTTTTTTTSSSAAPPVAQRQHTQSMPIPPYEEPQEGAVGRVQLQAVDEAIFAALRQAGLGPEQIRIQVQGSQAGELTQLEAHLRPGQDGKAVMQALSQGLSHTAAQSSWLLRPEGPLLKVWLGKALTHRVSLLASHAAGSPPATSPLTPPVQPPPHLPPLAPGQRPQVALVIDDMGYQVEAARRLLDLHLHLTLSILPQAPHAREIAELARQRGAPIMAHLPMEPRSYPALNPGPGALLVSMDPPTLSRVTRQALANLPGVMGANNHMGSRFTEHPEALQPVLEVLRQQGLFFLDSYTSPRSQAREQARRMGLPNAQRDVFLDHDPTAAAVTRQVLRLLKLAKTQGRVIAIGHPHATTIAVLTSMAARLKQEVELVPVSRLMTPAPQGVLDRPAARP